MSIDRTVLLDSYFTEMREHLDKIADTLNSLNENNSNLLNLSDILRDLHSIKGTSRLMGFTTIEQIVHGLEDVLNGVRENRYGFTRNLVQLVFLSISLIHQALQHIEVKSNDDIETKPFMDAFKKATTQNPFNLEKLSIFLQSTSDAVINDTEDVEDLEELSDLENIKNIRVNLTDINEIIEKMNTVIIREFKIKNEIEQLYNNTFISNKNAVQQKIRQLDEDVKLLETSLFETQNKVLLLRMLPLDIVLKPLRMSFESDTTAIKKQVKLSLPRTEIKLEKIILEQLSDIFIHLIRNALDHGIELPDIREKTGKNPTGIIKINTEQFENHIIISVKDDGAGLDYEKIRQTAIEKFPNKKNEIATMNNHELESFLFISGFTTTTKQSVLSGRGVGLDIVRTNLEKIKGQITIHTKKNEGTEFRLSIPLTLSTQEGLFVHSGGYKLLIPSQYISQIIEVNESEFIQLGEKTLLRFNENLIPIYRLSSLIKTNKLTVKQHKSETKIVIVQYLNKQTGFIVDKLENYASVVVKKLSSIFDSFKILQGVVFDKNYNFVPILNIPDAIRRASNLVAYDLKKIEAKTIQKNYSILIVDDSYTTRQIEKSILKTDNYIIDTSSNGIEALEKMKANFYNLVIFDIKMPQMDGFSLARNIRRMNDYINTPLIVVSSIYDNDTRKKFLTAGVQKYIIKSDFERGNLISAVKELLDE